MYASSLYNAIKVCDLHNIGVSLHKHEV